MRIYKDRKTFVGKYLWLVCCLFIYQPLQAQEQDSLSITDLIDLALEQNFDIKVARKQVNISENNVSLGNANYLPTLGVNGSYEYAVQDTDIEFTNPEQQPINADNAVTETASASVNLNYNIFSGGARNYTYARLQELNRQEQLRLRASMEQVILNVLQRFLDYANQSQIYRLDEKSVELSNRRYKRAKENFNYGVFTKLELLNAEVDLRNDSVAMLQSKIAVQKTEKQLLNLLSLKADTSLLIATQFEVSEDIKLDEVKQTAFNKNANYLLSESRIRASELALKETKSNWFPRLDLQASYRYNFQDNEASFIQTQETSGLNGSLQLSYDIFDGFNRKRMEDNSIITLENEQINKEKALTDLSMNITNTFLDYENGLALMSLNERNISAADQNFKRSEEAFANGQITGIELREAQLNLLNTIYSFNSQRIQAKIAEANMLFYAGMLVD